MKPGNFDQLIVEFEQHEKEFKQNMPFASAVFSSSLEIFSNFTITLLLGIHFRVLLIFPIYTLNNHVDPVESRMIATKAHAENVRYLASSMSNLMFILALIYFVYAPLIYISIPIIGILSYTMYTQTLNLKDSEKKSSGRTEQNSENRS
jgi:hypothetical protein